MLQEVLVEWETFNFKVWCVFGPHRLLPAYVKKRHRRVYRPKPKEAADMGGCYFRSKPKMGGILWLEKLPTTPKQLGYLAHEMGHAVMDMHTQRGLNLDSLNDETFCYAIAHGVTTFLSKARQTNRLIMA